MNDHPHEQLHIERQGADRKRPDGLDRSPQGSRAQQAFLAHMRHELRTPLNAILGYSEMLMEDAAKQDQAGFSRDLQRIHTAGNRLLKHVNALLDPAAQRGDALDLEAFGAHLHHELRTPLNAIVGYVEIMLEEAADRGLQDWLSDLQKIGAAAQRFLGCIDDIVDFSSLSAGELDFNRRAPDAAAIILEVVNTVRALDAQETGKGVQGTLLVVDDNMINRDMLSRRLTRQGHCVMVAEDGLQALEMLSTRQFDLVLLDVMMPEMNGYQLLQRLKTDPTLRDMPVIMISALDELDSVVRCLEIGAEDYLPKPFNPVLLRARVGACLEKKRLRDQEVEYLRHVQQITQAAAAVEAGMFEFEGLADIAQRPDGLGQLARVFQRMAREVHTRQQRLQQEVQQLRIEIDEANKARQVAEITETEYFQELQEKVRKLRTR
jgi:DNA-binding response OmpR family regulator